MRKRWGDEFNPEQVQELDEAFEIAWQSVKHDKGAELESEEHYRMLLAQQIIAIAQSGKEPSVEGIAKEAIRRFQQQIALEVREPDSKGG